MGELYYLPKRELSPEQREYWQHQLEASERAVEYAKRMLGIVAVERIENGASFNR